MSEYTLLTDRKETMLKLMEKETMLKLAVFLAMRYKFYVQM